MNKNQENLLKKALQEQLRQQTDQIPPQDELKKQHVFSTEFEKNMRLLGKSSKSGNSRSIRTKILRFGGTAAACLLLLLGVNSLVRLTAEKLMMGSAQSTMDVASIQEQTETAGDTTEDNSYKDDAVFDTSGAAENQTNAGKKEVDMEQAESDTKTSNQIIGWKVELQDADASKATTLVLTEDNLTESTQLITGLTAVYQKQSQNWMVIFSQDAPQQLLEGKQKEKYLLTDLGITESGTYRLLQIVNGQYQILDITLQKTDHWVISW